MPDMLKWSVDVAKLLRELNEELAEDAKRERREDRIDANKNAAEEFNFERDCGERE